MGSLPGVTSELGTGGGLKDWLPLRPECVRLKEAKELTQLQEILYEQEIKDWEARDSFWGVNRSGSFIATSSTLTQQAMTQIAAQLQKDIYGK